MKFVINKTILFDAEQGTLANVSQPGETKALSLTEIRLIRLFVDNPNLVLSRETLLIDVWEQHDLTPSLNNLNNYMSMVRRKLALLGLPDIIITIPKSGFCLKVDTVEAIDNVDKIIPLSADLLNNDDEHLPKEGEPSKTNLLFSRFLIYKAAFALLLCTISLAAVGYSIYFHINNVGRLPKNGLTFYKKIDNSDVYFLQGSLMDLVPGSQEDNAITKKIANSKYKTPITYIYLNKRLTNKSEHSNFIFSLCGNNKNEQCETTYIYNSNDI
ncbi:winged helix-turn-helix domain-containing protein [Serratia fonticola]|uniref:Helix-turn-helix domain-containing protein n=1 Tax=Serratia fonticola TaxID=47917 RepID=A0AAE7EJE3_SERFO|nr:helix-turn-helix domain-containing protein [Serratia fonticola]QKJ59933.1 helix-turn-helix domain-containing protein [Serratia fonticola]